MTKKDRPSLNGIRFQAQASSEEASFANTISPNSHRPRNSFIITDMDRTPELHKSYLSDYTSLGNALNHADYIKKKILLETTTDQATEIHLDLLSQLHEMQSLLEEYQGSLSSFEIEKADNQQEINRLVNQIKVKGEIEERYKEDIWNLELKNQELFQKINELSQDLSKSQAEKTRLRREESLLSQELDHLKALQQSWEQTIKDTQESHESEILSLKKSLHTNRLEKENLTKQIQEFAITRRSSVNTLRHVENEPTSHNQITEEKHIEHIELEDDTSSQHTITNYSFQRRNHAVEIDALKASLNQAHEIIQSMQETINRERSERVEIDKLLREAQETIENCSHTSSTHWYPHAASPNLSIHSPHCPHQHVPSSPTTIHSHHSSHPHQNCKKKPMALSSSHPLLLGKSLGDELSLAGSSSNLIIMSPPAVDRERKSELVLINLPPMSNFNPSPPPSVTKKVMQRVLNNENDQHYGSLLKKPESYFYKSTRRGDIQKPDEVTPSTTLFATETAESILKTKIDLFPNVKRKNIEDDISVIALTRTMIGDWMWKYTRKVMGSGISENKHRRFFWIHPYTQTLYWSSREPGSSVGISITKSGMFIKKRWWSLLIYYLMIVAVTDRNRHSLQFILSDYKSSVSKYHYLNRKKSRNQDAPSFYSSTVIDDLSDSSDDLLKS
ncbi:hypothetical protein BD770DRAFT_455553 [Pilaira anomala]|nr:hypothetical protein BD770DRAFT_455553 [Pilaira anomala]